LLFSGGHFAAVVGGVQQLIGVFVGAKKKDGGGRHPKGFTHRGYVWEEFVSRGNKYGVNNTHGSQGCQIDNKKTYIWLQNADFIDYLLL